MEAMFTVLCIRHGECAEDDVKRLHGAAFDPSLTTRGIHQAHLVGRRLATRADASELVVLTSPAMRARGTAAIVASELGTEPLVDRDLREIDVGELSGRSDNEAWALCESLKRRWARGDLDAGYPGGDDLRYLLDRMRRVFLHAARFGAEGHTVILIGHSGAFGVSLPQLFRGGGDRIGYCTVSEVRYAVHGGVPAGVVIAWADASHLRQLPCSPDPKYPK